MNIHNDIHPHTSLHVDKLIHTLHTYTYTFTYIHNINIHTCTYIYKYICIRIHLYTYTHIHTYTNTYHTKGYSNLDIHISLHSSCYIIIAFWSSSDQ